MIPDLHIHFPIAGGGSYLLRDLLTTDINHDPVLVGHPFHQQVAKFLRWWFLTQDDLILSTSGTTGTPKELRFNRHQIESAARSSMGLIGPQNGGHSLLAIDPSYVGGAMLVIRSLIAGADITCIPPVADPLALQRPELYQAIRYTALVPYQIRAILENLDSSIRLRQIETVLIGGAAISNEIRSQLKTFPNRIFSTYGMTETLSHVALEQITGDSDGYTPLPDIELDIQENGCLLIRSPWLGTVETQDRVSCEMLKGRIQKFRWLGRADRIINSGGHLINPENTESVLEELQSSTPEIVALFAAGVQDERLDQMLVIVIESTESTVHLKNRVEAFCRERFERLDRPRRIFFIDKILKTSSGKIDRIGTLKMLDLPVAR